MSAASLKTDVYSRITDKIILAIEKGGLLPWVKPWNAQHASGSTTKPLRANGIPYQGVNILILWLTSEERGYLCPLWLTFCQANDHGGKIRKGEKGTPVVYANTLTLVEEDKTTGEENEKQVPYLRQYTVFNAQQIEGLPSHYYALKEQPKNLAERLTEVESFVANTKAEIRHGGDRAYYSSTSDYIQMPPFECFVDRERYYGTLLHEMCHFSGHPSRLDRNLSQGRFGDLHYAAEELVAEIGAAFLSADLGICHEPRANHASYIENWLRLLKGDKRAIFTAAALAQKAVNFLHGLQPPHSN